MTSLLVGGEGVAFCTQISFYVRRRSYFVQCTRWTRVFIEKRVLLWYFSFKYNVQTYKRGKNNGAVD